MATKDVITKVWIEDGCIVCDACETAAPDVFQVTDDTCIIRPEALTPDFTQPRSESISDAAEECPVDVIKFDTVSVEAGDVEPAAAPAEPAPVVSEEKVPSKAPEAPSKVVTESKPAAATKAPDVESTAAGSPDPAIQALLRAATARGGNLGIERRAESIPDGIAAFQGKDPSQLPPDARQARVFEAARKNQDSSDPNRRAFVGSAALATGWIVFGVGTGISIGPAFARFMMPNVLEEPDPRVPVGKLQQYIEMAPGDVNEDYKPQGIWMIREESRIAALNIICTHLGCIPNWLPNDRKFKCPCHGSGYRPDGVNFEGPTPRPLERFKVFVEDGIVIVEKSKKYQHELGQWDMPGSSIEV